MRTVKPEKNRNACTYNTQYQRARRQSSPASRRKRRMKSYAHKQPCSTTHRAKKECKRAHPTHDTTPVTQNKRTIAHTRAAAKAQRSKHTAICAHTGPHTKERERERERKGQRERERERER